MPSTWPAAARDASRRSRCRGHGDGRRAAVGNGGRHLHAIHQWGLEFVRTYVGQEIVERAAGRLWPDQKVDRYAVELVRDDWPWLILTLIGTVQAVALSRRGTRPALFVLVWAMGYLAVLHLSAFRRGQYLMHFYPPASVLAALGVQRVLPERLLAPLARVAVIGFAAAGLLLAALPVTIRRPRQTELRALRPFVDRRLPAGQPLIGFHLNASERAASLVYLDRNIDDRTIAEMPHDGATVLSETGLAPVLMRRGFVTLYANKRYTLFAASP
jgi:hypothetical protein